ncbi:MAG: TatD family nuclease-associated radical SAM protein [Clostridia bacterium]|nr:TatD family nuclease-associated radical SAM protein [Clostridia bacterium]
MADIVYEFEGSLYLNITNECPCKCVFCVRDIKDNMGTGHHMWHEKAPSFEEIKAAIDATENIEKYNSIVFCGYGEPTCEFENLIKTAKYIKEKFGLKIRVNTNGLGSLYNKKDIVDELCENVDAVSVSLNAPNKERYLKITRNEFGIESFDAMLEFTKRCVEKGIGVRMTVVDILTKDEIKQCAEIATEIGAKFDARSLIKE